MKGFLPAYNRSWRCSRIAEFYVKVHRHQGHFLVAACDKDLLGKKIFWKEKGIYVSIDERFYGKEIISENDLEELLKQATSANLFGNEVVSFALKKGFIDKRFVIKIEGIMHAQFVHI